MANNPLPSSVKYYSVVSFTDRDRINRWLVSGYDMLKTIDPRNDGLLLFSDQVIPGSILLGYSKGATDILHFLVDYPEIAKKMTGGLECGRRD
jgi:hypothetical protein